MVYSEQEQYALAAALKLLLMANDLPTIKEQMFFLHITTMSNISRRICSAVENWTIDQIIPIAKSMTDEKKSDFLKSLNELVDVRGHNYNNKMVEVLNDLIVKCELNKSKRSGFCTKNKEIKIDATIINSYSETVKTKINKLKADEMRQIDEQVNMWSSYYRNFSLDELIDNIIYDTERNLEIKGWKLNNANKASWFLGLFSFIAVQSGLVGDFNQLFNLTFTRYFQKHQATFHKK